MISKLEKTKQKLTVKSSIYNPSPNVLDNFDPKILDFVVVLNHLGFNTFSSCQGHIDNTDYGSFYPFVMFCSETAEDFSIMSLILENRQSLITEYRAMLEEQSRIMEYLNEFYINRTTPMKHRLIIKTCSFCRSVIHPYFSILTKMVESKEEQTRLNKIYLKEIDDFTEFLKTKI